MQNEATKLANLNKHLEDIDKKCLEQSEKILTNGNLTPDEIVVMQRKQLEYNTAYQWLLNIKNHFFPSQIITQRNGIGN
jgi:hypothetical protein